MNFSKRIARESKREETVLREKIDEFKLYMNLIRLTR